MKFILRQGELTDRDSIYQINYDTWFRDDNHTQEEKRYTQAVASLDMNSYYPISNYLLLAESHDEVLGMILGNIPDENGHYFNEFLSDGQDEAYVVSKANNELRKDYQAFYESEKQFAKFIDKKVSQYDAYLNIFAVSNKAQGHGIGSALFKKAMSDLKEAGAKNFYLKTDTTCDYTFYDHVGMTQLIKQVEDNNYERFVYTGDLDEILGGL